MFTRGSLKWHSSFLLRGFLLHILPRGKSYLPCTFWRHPWLNHFIPHPVKEKQNIFLHFSLLNTENFAHLQVLGNLSCPESPVRRQHLRESGKKNPSHKLSSYFKINLIKILKIKCSLSGNELPRNLLPCPPLSVCSVLKAALDDE